MSFWIKLARVLQQLNVEVRRLSTIFCYLISLSCLEILFLAWLFSNHKTTIDPIILLTSTCWVLVYQWLMSGCGIWADFKFCQWRQHELARWRKQALEEACRALPKTQTDGYQSSKINHLLQYDLDQCADGLLSLLKCGEAFIITCLYLAVSFFYFEVWQILLGLPFILCWIVSVRWSQNVIQEPNRVWSQSAVRSEREVLPWLKHREHWLGLNKSRDVFQHCLDLLNGTQMDWFKSHKVRRVTRWIQKAVTSLSMILMVLIWTWTSEITEELLMGAVYFMVRVRPQIQTLANSFFDLWTLEPIIERIDQQLQAYEHLPSKTAKAVIQTETSPDLTFQDFSFGYDVGEPLIQNLTYRLDFGSIHLICGLNGSGKTTLLKCCAGFWKPDQGQIKLGNLSSSDSNYADEVGFCPADNWRLPSTDLETNLAFFKVTHQQSDPAEHQYTIHSWLDELKQIDPEHYSRGQARKLTLLRFFSHQRQVYLLDEPCENLDDKARDALIQTCQKLSEKHIVVVASHHPQWKKSGHKEVPWS